MFAKSYRIEFSFFKKGIQNGFLKALPSISESRYESNTFVIEYLHFT